MPSPQQRTGCRTLWTTSMNPWHPRVISRTVVVVLGVWQDHTEAVLLREEGPEWLLKHVLRIDNFPQGPIYSSSARVCIVGKTRTDRTRLKVTFLTKNSLEYRQKYTHSTLVGVNSSTKQHMIYFCLGLRWKCNEIKTVMNKIKLTSSLIHLQDTLIKWSLTLQPLRNIQPSCRAVPAFPIQQTSPSLSSRSISDPLIFYWASREARLPEIYILAYQGGQNRPPPWGCFHIDLTGTTLLTRSRCQPQRASPEKNPDWPAHSERHHMAKSCGG